MEKVCGFANLWCGDYQYNMELIQQCLRMASVNENDPMSKLMISHNEIQEKY